MNAQHTYDHLLSFCLEQPWALTRPMLTVIAGLLGQRLAGAAPSTTELRPRPSTPGPAGVAVIPIHGVIAPRMNLMSDMSGGVTYQGLRNDLRQALENPDVRTIVLDVNSPGGSVAGVSECATAILAARQRKPVVAVAEYQMCSAAYWLGSCATDVVAAPSAQLGSIGVFTIHEDLSRALEQLGVKLSLVSAGKFKTEGNPTEPLTVDARARLQQQVDSAYGRFVADIARGRGVTAAAVRSGFGEGAVVGAEDALRLGMVNRIATLEDTLTHVVAQPPKLTPTRRPTTITAVRPTSPVLAASTRRTLDTYRQQLAQASGGRLR